MFPLDSKRSDHLKASANKTEAAEPTRKPIIKAGQKPKVSSSKNAVQPPILKKVNTPLKVKILNPENAPKGSSLYGSKSKSSKSPPSNDESSLIPKTINIKNIKSNNVALDATTNITC